MSSILTNSSAMTALETLRGINSSLEGVQSEISTGKKISSSTDNAAIWSVATVMESDVSSFDQVSDSLNLGSATVGVAQAGAEQVTDLLTEAKELIVAANDPSISDSDREKYQTDISELTKTVGSIVDAASFNGQNLLKGEGDIEVLSSLNRQDDGTVTAGKVSVARQDLSVTAGVQAADAVAGGVAAAGEAGALSIGEAAPADGADSVISIAGGAGAVTEGSTYALDVGGTSFSYTAAEGDDINAVNAGLAAAIDADGSFSASVTTSADDPSVDGASFTITNNSGAASTVSGNVSTIAAAAEEGLAAIDALLQTAIDATAQFGSKQKRIDNQNEFVTQLSDSLKTGIGAMTDANLEEASARLQSLQVQQQLGVQALGIANSAPQQLLSLFG